MDDWLRNNPNIDNIRVAAADLNGQPRGKRVPHRYAEKATKGGVRFPYSVMNLDICGDDIEGSPLVFDTGDADGALHPTSRGLMPVPWLKTPTALLPVWMYHDDGTPFVGDPRHALDAVVQRYRDKGLTPVCAVELEFFLMDDSGPRPRVAASPLSSKRRRTSDTLSLQALDQFDTFFTDLYAACEAMDIPADTATSESANGQFEINLMHGDDPLKAADDAWLFKMLVKGLARQHGFVASFMAKPFDDRAGSGLHTHFSVLDSAGANIFDNGGPEGTAAMQHAIAGLMAALQPSTLIFAPHANSYERLVPHAHAPTGVAWAYDNRTASIRVPAGPPKARRIEHRVAGGDVNPYLMLAAVLGAALNGMEDAAAPPAPITGNAYDLDLPQIPSDWSEAISLFETAPQIARIFSRQLIDNLVLTKQQELRVMAPLSPQEQVEIYLETV